MVSAWSAANGISLGQVKVDYKSSETTAIPLLINSLELSGCIVKICVREKQRKKREHNKQIVVCKRLLYRIFFFWLSRRIFMLCRSHNKITFQYNVLQFYNAHTMLSRNKVS